MENSRRKIFIGGLPANITETQLKEHFAKYGTVGFLFLFFLYKTFNFKSVLRILQNFKEILCLICYSFSVSLFRNYSGFYGLILSFTKKMEVSS